MKLTDLSNEIIHDILFFVDALDIARISQTCRHFRDLIARDDLLWKRIYLATFNEPLHVPDSWAIAVQNLVRAKKILESKDFEIKRDQTAFIGSQILPLILSTKDPKPIANIKWLRPFFYHLERRTTASTLLRQSSLFRRCGTPNDLPADSPYLRQLSARLHVYSGLPLEVRESEFADVEGSHYIHPCARSRVYDLRRYKTSNFWGPFMPDGSGRIDWERVQSIWLVLGYGLRMISERTQGNLMQGIGRGMGVGLDGDNSMWDDLGTNSYKSLELRSGDDHVDNDETRSTAATNGGSEYAEEPEPPTEDGVPTLEWFEEKYPEHKLEPEFQRQQAIFAKQDPYGVTGTWMRVVNFLDYHDLFALNFSNTQNLPDEVEREPVDTAEAFRLILLTLWITKIEWPDEDEGQAEDWETIADSEESTASTPAPSGMGDGQTERENGRATPRPPEQVLERTGSTNSDGLYHKPAYSPERSTTNGDTAQRKPSPKKKAKYPIVHFEGRSRSLHIRWDPNANSYIRGQVRAYPSPPAPAHEFQNDCGVDLSHIFPSSSTTATSKAKSPPPTCSSASPNGLHAEDDLVIRWTTFSIFHGEPRWRSEGVQIGGLKSARGILGNWFDKDYDPHGPAGPTGFWKVKDDCRRYPIATSAGFGTVAAGVWDTDSD